MRMQRIFRKVIQVIFVLSVPFFTLTELHSALDKPGYLISLAAAFVIGIAISGRVVSSLWEDFRWGYFLVAAAAAVYIAYKYAWQGNGVSIMQQYQELLELILPVRVTSRRLAAGLMLVSFPAIGLLFYFILSKVWSYIVRFFQSLDQFEKRYLLAVVVIAAGAVSFFYLHTSVCYYAVWDDAVQLYDVIYTTDSTEIYVTDCFWRVLAGPNDIRQPLFGLFALPVGLAAKAVAAVFFFVPEAYAIAVSVIQVLLLAVTVIMLLRMLRLEGKERIWFVLLTGSSYAYILYSFLIEQYVVAYFYVILVLYVCQKSDRLNFAYFGAVSTLLTSGVLFPLITKEKRLKYWVRDMFKCLAFYFGIATVCGQLPQLLDMKGQITELMFFSGEKVSWTDKWIQFTHFFKDMFWAPEGVIGSDNFMSYGVAENTAVSYVGIAVLAVALTGFLLNYREWLSRVAALWVLFSAALLFVVGWGTAENGLILYALYFAWAYIVLIYQALQKLIQRPAVRCGVIACLSLAMLIRNIYEIVRIYQFGITYYPAS